MLSPDAVHLLSILGMLTISVGILCCVYIALDQPHRQAPDMPVMKWVWPVNALWAGPLAILAYRVWGNGRSQFVRTGSGKDWCPVPSPAESLNGKAGMFTTHEAAMPNAKPHEEAGGSGMEHGEATQEKMPGMTHGAEPMPPMSGMEHDRHDMASMTQDSMNAMMGMPPSGMEMPMGSAGMSGMGMGGMDMSAMSSMDSGRSFPAKVAVGTLHCGAGCTLADLVGPWLFLAVSFTVLDSLVFGEWALEYVLALLFGVIFQYAGLASMVKERGAALWWRAFRVDFLSLTAWQVGMYAWMALCNFVLIGPMSPTEPLFWFMMQIAMACGYATAYPMNWLLIRSGIKTAM